jgi:drug/metabolite transporter (DMT)-like permease
MSSNDEIRRLDVDAKSALQINTSEAKPIKWLVWLSYSACCLIWGTTWYAIRVSVEPGDGFPPNFASVYRFLIAIVFYIPLWFIFAKQLKRPPLSDILWVFLAGLLNGLYQCFMYRCEMSISGGLASVIMATSPLMVASIAVISGIEKVRRQTVVSFMICLAGVALVCFDRFNTSIEQIWGICFALIAAFFTSLSNITLKGRGSGMHSIISATILITATSIPVAIGSIICGEKAVFWPVATAPMLAVVYMAIMSSVVAYLFYVYMVKHMSLMALSTMQFVLPVFALTVDLFLEKRMTLSPQIWIGSLIVLVGVIVSVRRFD